MKTVLLYKILIVITLLNAHLFAQLEPISVQLKWFYQFQFAGIVMAKERGFYEEAGLDVTIKERDPKFNNIEQVLNGDSEYGVADAAILRYRAQGYPVKVLATIFQHNAMVLISKKGSGILSPYEIKGKKISFQKSLDDSVIVSLLHFANLDDSDYIFKPMDFSKMDFVRGDVDVTEAYISIEPYWMREKYGIELNIINPRNYGVDIYGDLIFTTEEEIKHHPLRAKAFRDATIKGWRYALRHKEETIQLLIDKYDTRGLFDRSALRYEAQMTEKLISPEYIKLGSVQKERFQVLAEMYARRGMSQFTLTNAVNSIIYAPESEENFFYIYRYYIISFIFIMTLTFVLLLWHNRRLRYLVHKRTEELEIAKSLAEESAKSKASFLANMSHEIRTPMNAILGFVEQLAKSEKDEKRVEMFRTIKNSGQNLLTIINDILDISKFESGKITLGLEATDIRLLIQELGRMFEQKCHDEHRFLFITIAKEIPECSMVDQTRLMQILVNLVANAIKFTANSGRVEIDLDYDCKAKKYYISVKDNGIGIADENIEKIFHVFEQEDETTTKRFGGTGLGLAISQKLATLMDGKIEVNSQIDIGSIFTLVLPHRECHKAVVQKSVEVEDQEFKLEGRVLVVEDNKTNQMLMSFILDELDLEYEVANNGKEALEMVKESSYDIILMDENMPVMSGIEATKNIRKLESEGRVESMIIIAVTANAMSEDRAKFLTAGMDDYLAKPYSEESVVSILRKYLQK